MDEFEERTAWVVGIAGFEEEGIEGSEDAVAGEPTGSALVATSVVVTYDFGDVVLEYVNLFAYFVAQYVQVRLKVYFAAHTFPSIPLNSGTVDSSYLEYLSKFDCLALN